MFASVVHLQEHIGKKAIIDLRKEDNCIDNLLYWALKGEHASFYFGSVSTTKHAFNPLKSDLGTADSLLGFNKE